ncbi:MAG: protein kinase, partial [archaeon]|nr:protein kinase [archaeon]
MDSKKSLKRICFNKQIFIGVNDEGIKVTDRYKVIKTLGKGSYGVVYAVLNKTTNEKRACKVLSKKKVGEDFLREKDIMMKVNHPNIIKLYEIYEDPKFYYMVIELCTGGELFDRIIEKTENNTYYSEKEAAEIFKKLLLALSYCHDQGICHKDLKPENLLLATKEPDSEIKVIDFGLSQKITKGEKMKRKVGTAYYVAPEILKGNYGIKCDIWSAGVILYILLSGIPPFNGSTDTEIYKKISEMKFTFPSVPFDRISEEAKDLIKKMLTPEGERPTAAECLKHKWFDIASEKTEKIDFNLESFKTYVYGNKLKKAALTFIAERMKDQDVEKLKNKFMEMDKDKNGTISYEELKEGLSPYGLAENQIKEMFDLVDTDKSGAIDYTEFIASVLDVENNVKEAYIQEAFISMDTDNSGKISKEEFMKLFKINEGDAEMEELMKHINKIDENGDGEIDYDEFVKMI